MIGSFSHLVAGRKLIHLSPSFTIRLVHPLDDVGKKNLFQFTIGAEIENQPIHQFGVRDESSLMIITILVRVGGRLPADRRQVNEL